MNDSNRQILIGEDGLMLHASWLRHMTIVPKYSEMCSKFLQEGVNLFTQLQPQGHPLLSRMKELTSTMRSDLLLDRSVMYLTYVKGVDTIANLSKESTEWNLWTLILGMLPEFLFTHLYISAIFILISEAGRTTCTPQALEETKEKLEEIQRSLSSIPTAESISPLFKLENHLLVPYSKIKPILLELDAWHFRCLGAAPTARFGFEGCNCVACSYFRLSAFRVGSVADMVNLRKQTKDFDIPWGFFMLSYDRNETDVKEMEEKIHSHHEKLKQKPSMNPFVKEFVPARAKALPQIK